jgi:hypothetical protein
VKPGEEIPRQVDERLVKKIKQSLHKMLLCIQGESATSLLSMGPLSDGFGSRLLLFSRKIFNFQYYFFGNNIAA